MASAKTKTQPKKVENEILGKVEFNQRKPFAGLAD